MEEDRLSREVEKVFRDPQFPHPLNVAMSCLWILADHHGTGLKVLKMENVSSLSQYAVIASGKNTAQVRAMGRRLVEQMKRKGVQILSREGLENADWALLDLGDVIVHIFLDSVRDRYRLDELWSQAVSLPIPTHYYFPEEKTEKEPEEGEESEESEGTYF